MKLISLDQKQLSIKECNLIINSNSCNNNNDLNSYLQEFKQDNSDIILSIVIPVFNEENTIGEIIHKLPKGDLIEFIVVDDKSEDGSVKEIKKALKKFDFRFFKHNKNMGYGGALITGISKSKGNIVVTMDSDGQHCPSDIFNLIDPILKNQADLTIGSRYLGYNYYQLPIYTRLGEAIVEKIIKLLFGPTVMNNQNGFRAFNAKVKDLYTEGHYYGYTLATDIIIKAAIKRLKIMERPIKVYHRKYGTSKIKLWKLTIDLFSCVLLNSINKLKSVLLNIKTN